MTVFETAPFDHSGISPRWIVHIRIRYECQGLRQNQDWASRSPTTSPIEPPNTPPHTTSQPRCLRIMSWTICLTFSGVSSSRRLSMMCSTFSINESVKVSFHKFSIFSGIHFDLLEARGEICKPSEEIILPFCDISHGTAELLSVSEKRPYEQGQHPCHNEKSGL